MSKVLVDRELLESVLANWHHISTADWDALKACTDQPAEAEGAEVVGYASAGAIEILREIPQASGMKVRGCSKDRFVVPLVRQSDHLAALSAVTAERDRLLAELERAYANYNQVSYASTERGKQIDQLQAEVEMLREDAERWRYVSLQGDDTHWLNLLRVDLEDFGGNINAAVDALIDGDTPVTAAKEA